MYIKSLQWKIKLATIRNSLFCSEATGEVEYFNTNGTTRLKW